MGDWVWPCLNIGEMLPVRGREMKGLRTRVGERNFLTLRVES